MDGELLGVEEKVTRFVVEEAKICEMMNLNRGCVCVTWFVY